LGKKGVGDPHLVGKSILATGKTFEARRTGVYFRSLMRPRRDIAAWRRDLALARQTWSEMTHALGLEDSPGNLLYDGGFEHEFLNIGFGWYWQDIPPSATLVMDHDSFQEGRRAVRIDFDGSENMGLRAPFQLIAVEPRHRYVLTAQIRSEKITGGSGPRLAVRAYGASAAGSAEFDALGREVFDTRGWIQDRIEFVVPPNVPLLAVMADREPSRKLNPKISGSFWMDDLVLRDLGESRAAAAGDAR
jgi:hypothetical protein